jgi:hypothetical protein
MSIILATQWTGCCNQIFALITGLIKIKAKRIPISGFAPALGSTRRIPASKIFDFADIKRIYDVELVDRPALVGQSTFGWYTQYNEARFVRMLKSLKFTQPFEDLADELLTLNFDLSQPLHVVHFRIEKDALAHWSKINGLTPAQFEKVLHTKYRQAVLEHIPVGSQILALTYSLHSPLLKELGNKYQIRTLDSECLIKERISNISGRELCAIIDLLAGSRCTGTFVGCHNLGQKRGSTFSYMLWQKMQKGTAGVFIDLDNISNTLSRHEHN